MGIFHTSSCFNLGILALRVAVRLAVSVDEVYEDQMLYKTIDWLDGLTCSGLVVAGLLLAALSSPSCFDLQDSVVPNAALVSVLWI